MEEEPAVSVEMATPEEVAKAESEPERTVTAVHTVKKNCRWCHGSGILKYIENTSVPKGGGQHGPCFCFTKLTKKVVNTLDTEHELDAKIELENGSQIAKLYVVEKLKEEPKPKTNE